MQPEPCHEREHFPSLSQSISSQLCSYLLFLIPLCTKSVFKSSKIFSVRLFDSSFSVLDGLYFFFQCTLPGSVFSRWRWTLNILHRRTWQQAADPRPWNSRGGICAPSWQMRQISGRSQFEASYISKCTKSNKCNQCNYAPSQSGNLKTHLNIHYMEKSQITLSAEQQGVDSVHRQVADASDIRSTPGRSWGPVGPTALADCTTTAIALTCPFLTLKMSLVPWEKLSWLDANAGS